MSAAKPESTRPGSQPCPRGNQAASELAPARRPFSQLNSRRVARRPPEGGIFARVTPELVAAASDNDPTTVGTAVVVGAQTAYQLSWVALLVAPLLAVVQTIAAQVAGVARADLQQLTVRRYGRRVGALLALSIVPVNLLTAAADLRVSAAAIGVLLGTSSRWLSVPVAGALGTILLVGKYRHAILRLRWALVGFLGLAMAAVVLSRPDWAQVARDSLIPRLSPNRDQLRGLLALLGTTLTGYVYVWETVARGVEEPRRSARLSSRKGAMLGAGFTALTLWCVVVASAATLGQHHQSVTSLHDAAEVLGPLAGGLAVKLFAAVLLVSGVVALPVITATTAYVVGAQFGIPGTLSQQFGRAKRFYALIATSMGASLMLTLLHVSVVGMLIWASVLGALGTPIGLVVLIRLARDPDVMGNARITRRLALAGWTIAGVVACAGLFVLSI